MIKMKANLVKRSIRAIIVVAVIALAVAIAWLVYQSRLVTQQIKGEAEVVAAMELNAAANKLDGMAPENALTLRIGRSLIDRLLQTQIGRQIDLGPAVAELSGIECDFSSGVPTVKLEVKVGAGSHDPVTLNLDTVVVAAASKESVTLDMFVTDLTAVGGVFSKPWVRDLIEAVSLNQINQALPTLNLPVPAEQTLVAATDNAIDQEVNTSNGSITVRIQPPTIPPIRRRIEPVAVFAKGAELVVVAKVVSGTPVPGSAEVQSVAGGGNDNATGIEAAKKNLHRAFQKWTSSGSLDTPARGGGAKSDDASASPSEGDAQAADDSVASLRVLVGRQIFLDAIDEIRQWPADRRTVTVNGLSQKGNIVSKSGGAPFGNGFKAYLESPGRLKAKAVVDLAPAEWGVAKNGSGNLTIVATTTVSAEAQIHVHGNAPRIQPKILGVRIGGGVKVGGGAGTSVGVDLKAPKKVEGVALSIGVENTGNGIGPSQSLEIRLASDIRETIKFDINGVPDALEHAVDAGFPFELEKGLLLYRIALPEVISTGVITELEGAQLSGAPDLSWTAAGIQFDVDVELDGKVGAGGD